ncbi:MAG: hypothetical protein ACSHX8_11080 [Opitutaceae bacterium]
MKSLLSALFLNLKMGKQSAQLDSVVRNSAEKANVDASVPTCVPSI